MENRSIHGLDLVRFAAAAMVMWFHLAYFSWFDPDSSPGRIADGSIYLPTLSASAWWGWVGVEIFFVISGFVITRSAQGRSAKEFAIGRAVRLYPAVWISATITLVVLLLLGHTDQLARRYGASMTLFPLGPWVDGVYWTLGVEVAFYGLVWLLLAFSHQKHLPWLLAAIGVPSIILWGAYAAGFAVPRLLLSRYAELLLIPHGCFFALGGLLCLRASIRGSIKLIAAASLLAGIAAIHSISSRGASGFSSLVPISVWLLGVGAIWASDHWREGCASLVGRHGGKVRLLGLATYPLYLLHDVSGAAILKITNGLPDLVSLGIAIAAATIASFVVATMLEKPLQRALRNGLTAAFEAAKRMIPADWLRAISARRSIPE
jgi:peptidoglycan/LPS O-acetylase OafA/YrhL